MNFKNEIIEQLKIYKQRKNSLEHLREEIEYIESKKTSMKGASLDRAPICGGSSHHEEELLNNICKLDTLRKTYEINTREVSRLEKAMKCLNKTEALVIDTFFINKPDKRMTPVEKLNKELNYERSRIYEIRDECIIKMAHELYGRTEI